MTLIIDIISLVITIIAMYFIGVYNLHMFQQNTYINSEHAVWLEKFNERQRVLLLSLIFGLLVEIALELSKEGFIGIFYIFIAIVMLIYYIKIEKLPMKKPLVWTDRAKRIFITYLILNLILAAAVGFLISKKIGYSYAFMGIWAIISPYLMILSNIINYPMEKYVRNYYINDAKKILKKMPDMRIIGITGSYGKTSVKYYLETLLKSKFNVVKTPASFNTPMGIVKTIREDIKPDTEIFLCEMGARKVGEIKELCDIAHPDDGVITSIGPQHLETFLSMENIVSTKYELGDAVNQKGNGRLFLNMDCDYVRNNCEKYKDIVPYYVNGKKETKNPELFINGYYATDVKVNDIGTEFTMHTPNGEIETYQMKLIGAHNVINVVGAIAVANIYGIPLNKLKTQVRRLRPAPHRLSIIPKGNITIIDDAYNSNPVGSKAAVETLAMFSGVKILITPGMVELGDKEEEYNKAFGNYAAECCDYVALVGEKHTKPIYEGLIEKSFDKNKIFVCERLSEAMEFVTKINAEDKKKFVLLENDLTDNY